MNQRIYTRSAAQIAIFSIATTLMMTAASSVFSQTSAKKATANAAQAPAPASPELLALAERVETGRFPCELGAAVTVTKDRKHPGYFDVSTGSKKFHMIPVATTTGAIRLEDKKAGGVWLGLANKSMLLNEKVGQRLADECKSAKQQAVAEQLKAAPAANPLDDKK